MMHNRHRDFQRIYDEFCKHYGLDRGESEFYDWIRDLDLDESKPYGASREEFQWAKDMMRYLREDDDNRYYGCLVSLPITSMNNNVYAERDLVAASTTIKGRSPSMQHSDAYWLKDGNRWGPAVTVYDSQYSEGANEVILKVPKETRNPFNENQRLYQLIDSKGIVNVSLEGTNSGAFEYGNPPFTLLLSNTLPGIPLARIKPLEKIVSEAFQTLQSSNNERQKKMKIKLTMKEETDPAKMGKQKNTEDPNVYANVDAGRSTGPSGQDGGYRGNLTDVSQQTDVAAGADPAAAKPEGVWQTTQNDMGEPVPHEGMAGTPGKDPPTEPIQPGAPMPEVDSHKGPDSNPIGRVLPKAGVDNKVPLQTWASSTGQMAPSDITPTGGSYPHEDLESARARINAELKAASSEERALKWEEQYKQAFGENLNLKGQVSQANITIKSLTDARDEANREMHNREVERDSWNRKYEKQLSLATEYKTQIESIQAENTRITEKYQGSLAQNLELSKKLTKANEEYLEVHRQLEATKEALERTRIEAKKIIKIKA